MLEIEYIRNDLNLIRNIKLNENYEIIINRFLNNVLNSKGENIKIGNNIKTVDFTFCKYFLNKILNDIYNYDFIEYYFNVYFLVSIIEFEIDEDLKIEELHFRIKELIKNDNILENELYSININDYDIKTDYLKISKDNDTSSITIIFKSTETIRLNDLNVINTFKRNCKKKEFKIINAECYKDILNDIITIKGDIIE